MSDLKLCPFCGKDDCLWNGVPYCLLNCESQEETIKRWNTRPREEILELKLEKIMAEREKQIKINIELNKELTKWKTWFMSDGE